MREVSLRSTIPFNQPLGSLSRGLDSGGRSLSNCPEGLRHLNFQNVAYLHSEVHVANRSEWSSVPPSTNRHEPIGSFRLNGHWPPQMYVGVMPVYAAPCRPASGIRLSVVEGSSGECVPH